MNGAKQTIAMSGSQITGKVISHLAFAQPSNTGIGVLCSKSGWTPDLDTTGQSPLLKQRGREREHLHSLQVPQLPPGLDTVQNPSHGKDSSICGGAMGRTVNKVLSLG